MPRPKPFFAEKSELARYVDQDEIKNGGRVSSAAFTPNPDEPYLSVNSVELESYDEIAKYYSQIFSSGSGEVAIACRNIAKYNDVARGVGISISWNAADNTWEYGSFEGQKEAYKHRPTPISYSHCGVEFINDSVEKLTLKKIARRLSGERPHLHTVTL